MGDKSSIRVRASGLPADLFFAVGSGVFTGVFEKSECRTWFFCGEFVVGSW
jgi:hypothetical protein